MKWPQGWREVVLDDACEINPRLSADEKPPADTPVSFVAMSAVDETHGAIAAPETRLYSEVQRGYTPFRNGDVLFAKVTPCMQNGKAAIARNLENGIGFGSTEFHVLRPDLELILPEYLFYFIRQPAFRARAAASFMGTGGLQRVPAVFFKRVKLPLPPLPEQRLIVEAFHELDAVTRESATSSDKLAAVVRHRFLQLFGHPTSNPKGFPKHTLGALGELDRGVSKHRPRDAAHLYGGPFPFIQTGDVARAGDWITSFQRTYSEAGRAQSRLWAAGTLCITIAANIGKTAILDFDACFPDSVVGFSANDGVATEYILYCLKFMQEVLKQRAQTAAHSNINLDTLRKLMVPLPPPALQNQFATFLQEVRAIEKVSAERESTLRELQGALSRDAFLGRLTAAWRTKHSAELDGAAHARDAVLTAAPLGTAIKSEEQAPPERDTGFARPPRRALVRQLSDFQTQVWNTLRFEWRGAVLPDDPDMFEAFCTSPQSAWRLDGFGAARDEVRRVLEQLAATGLVRKMSLPYHNPTTDRIDYLTAFRALRADERGGPEEDSATEDADNIERILREQQER